MGGAVGHLMHVYDDPEMTISEMKSLLSDAAAGKLQDVTEKMDGQSIVISYDVKNSELRVARNAGDIKRGGLSGSDISLKFAGRGTLSDSFNLSFHVINRALSAIPHSEAVAIFGQSKERWYSAEVLYTGCPNVINYSSNVVVFHGTPVFSVLSDGTVRRDASHIGHRILLSQLDCMRAVLSGSGWEVTGPVEVKFSGIQNSAALTNVIEAIDAAVASMGLAQWNTVQDFELTAVNKLLVKRGFDAAQATALASRIVTGTPNVREIKRMTPGKMIKEIDDAVDGSFHISSEAMSPLANATSKFAACLLDGFKSSAVSDHAGEVERLQKAVGVAIKEIESYGNQAGQLFVAQQLAKLGSAQDICSSAEGITFRHNEKLFKMTGHFAATNQLLGFTRYKRDNTKNAVTCQ